MGEYRIVLLRHGESVGNANNYHQGQFDFPLTDLGRQQVHRLLERWLKEGKQFDRVIASPLKRARETAEIIANGLNLPIEFEDDWMERNNGALQGLPEDTARILYPAPDFFSPFDPIVGNGEGDWELYLRAGRALLKLLRRPAGSYLVVSHGGLLNQAICAILEVAHHANGKGAHFRFGNTAFATFIYRSAEHCWIVCGMNDAMHLYGEDTKDD